MQYRVGLGTLLTTLVLLVAAVPPVRGDTVHDLERCQRTSQEDTAPGAVRTRTTGEAQPEQPDQWVYVRLEEAPFERCTGTLRSGAGDLSSVPDTKEEGYLWWPFDPLPNQGGVELGAGAVSLRGRELVVSDIKLTNSRPVDARLRRITLTALDEAGRVVADGRSRTRGVSPEELANGLVIPRNGTVAFDELISLRLQVDPDEVPDAVDLSYEVETYDRFYRVAPGSEVGRYTTAAGGRVTAPRSGPVRLRLDSDTCLGSVAPRTYDEAVAELGLPRLQYLTGKDRSAPDEAFVVALELVRWPEWDDIVKAGAVIGERPLSNETGMRIEVGSDRYPISPGGGYELCATDLRIRIASITFLPKARDDDQGASQEDGDASSSEDQSDEGAG